MLFSLDGSHAGIRKEATLMHSGAEYLVILNDRRLREAYIQRHQREARSTRQRQTGRSRGATPPTAHVLSAMRDSLMRFRQLTPSASVDA